MGVGPLGQVVWDTGCVRCRGRWCTRATVRPTTDLGGTPCEESLFVFWRSLLCWAGLFSLVPAWLLLIRDVR
jgi:hypothetical protein